MEKKTIAETINVRINVGNFQHIEISKYASKDIEYDNHDEMIEKEDQLTQELLSNIIRNMRIIPNQLGKKTNAVEDFEDRTAKTLPDFMKGAEEPNLAKKNHIKTEAQEKDNTDKKIEAKKEKSEEVKNLIGDKKGSEDKSEEDDFFGKI